MRFNSGQVYAGWIKCSNGQQERKAFDNPVAVTHWMPLPEPPSKAI